MKSKQKEKEKKLEEEPERRSGKNSPSTTKNEFRIWMEDSNYGFRATAPIRGSMTKILREAKRMMKEEIEAPPKPGMTQCIMIDAISVPTEDA